MIFEGKFSMIVASTREGGIGLGNKIPWNYPEDLKWFRSITVGSGNNAVLMGRKTYESLGDKFPLKDRYNFVLSRKTIRYPGIVVFPSIKCAIEVLENSSFDKIFVIGGAQVYSEFLGSGKISSVFLTLIKKDYSCDTFINMKDVFCRFSRSMLLDDNDCFIRYLYF